MIKTELKEFEIWLSKPEDYDLEFKQAKSNFSVTNLLDYCAAIANEGGGRLILGVAPKTHVVVGTQVYIGTHTELPHTLLQSLKIRINVEELTHPKGRVLIFHIPKPPAGQLALSSGKYKYPMRVGESLVEMDSATLKKKFLEETDFSATIVTSLTMADLDRRAIQNFVTHWSKKSRRPDYVRLSPEKVMQAVGLLSSKGLNVAALVLFGRREKIDHLLPASEIIFEWRQTVSKTAYDDRVNWRGPFFKIYDEVWAAINARNLRISFHEGLFQKEVLAYNEKAIREALNNAVAHRDYSLYGRSIFIKASPEEFCIESPGGFPTGVTPENILEKSCWRNRMIAEVLEKAGLVERSGQGVDDIYESTILEGKGLPSFAASDEHSVILKIPAQVKDKNFISFLERITKDKNITLSFGEIYELERIREADSVRNPNPKFRDKFLKQGLIEKTGTTNDSKYILSEGYYRHEGKSGVHTRLKGLSRTVKKELIFNHIRQKGRGRSEDFIEAFELKPKDASNLLQELKVQGKIVHAGPKRGVYWKVA